MREYFGAIKLVYHFTHRHPSIQKRTYYQVEVVGVGCCWSCGDNIMLLGSKDSDVVLHCSHDCVCVLH